MLTLPKKIPVFRKLFKDRARVALISLSLLVGLELAIIGVPKLNLSTKLDYPNRSGLGVTSSSDFDIAKEKAYWESRINEIGAEASYLELKEKIGQSLFGIQHTAAHLFGSVLYQKKSLEGLAVCDGSFAFGCFHGFFGEALANEGISIIQKLNQTCLDKFGPLGTGCQHGIGHGIMDYYGPKKLAEALNACLATTQEKPIFGCTSGVFMEYNLPVVINSPTDSKLEPRTFDQNKPDFPCQEIPARFQSSCYFELAQWWFQVLNGNYQNMGVLCGEVTDRTFREYCFTGMGNIAAPSTNYDPTKTIDLCQKIATKEGQLYCRAGASWSFYAQPTVRDLSIQICSGLSEADANLCVQKSDLTGDRSRTQ